MLLGDKPVRDGASLSGLGSGGFCFYPKVRVVILFAGQERPCHPHRFVRQGHGGDIFVAPAAQTLCPPAQSVILVLGCLDHRARAVNQQSTQVGIAAFANAQQLVFAATAMLARNQSTPSGGISPALEHPAVAQCGNQYGGGDLRRIPTLYSGEQQLPVGPSAHPPRQPALEGLAPDLSAIVRDGCGREWEVNPATGEIQGRLPGVIRLAIGEHLGSKALLLGEISA